MYVHPASFLVIGALGVILFQGKLRGIWILLSTAFALFQSLRLTFDQSLAISFLYYPLELLHVDSLSFLFGLIFCLACFLISLFALHNLPQREHISSLLYAASALGVVYAGDWISLFVFWELMSVASFFLIWWGPFSHSRRAGRRYILFHALGGGFLFFGILLLLQETSSLNVIPLSNTDSWAFWLILLGVVINAAVPPFHAWLSDAYPEASATSSVFLSVFTTKTAVYVLLRVFPGTEILIPLGVAMALYGVVYAVLENDIRRLLAYHIISQVGYMVTGVGLGTSLSLNGSAAHAFCHILYKALLFMGTGAVIFATGKRKLTELGGIYKSLFWVFLLYMVGGVSISGFPLFNGFVSKSMVVEGAALANRPWVETLLMLASVGTFLHTGLKLPYFTFFGPKKLTNIHPIPKNMYAAMILTAMLCFGIGVYPNALYRLLPHSVSYHPYTFHHVLASLLLLLGTGIAFKLFIKGLGGEKTVSLDIDWIYRKPLYKIALSFSRGFQSITYQLDQATAKFVESLFLFLRNPFALFSGNGSCRIYDENRYRFPIGISVLAAISGFVFLAFLLF